MAPDARHAEVVVRAATLGDLEAVRAIYNQGIEDRCATLETAPHDARDMTAWWDLHDNRYVVVVAEDQNAGLIGWGSLNRFSHRCAHNNIADLSVYVARSWRGNGIGTALLTDLVERARGSFHKIVLHALDDNIAGKHLYASLGFRKVGVFCEHGDLDGKLVDVVAMERLLP